MDAWSHGDNERFRLDPRPAQFLPHLHETGNVAMGPIVETMIDGRPAFAADLPGTGGNDIHVSPAGGLGGEYMSLGFPSRLIVSDIDGHTIFILIWARWGQNLTEWMPVAERFVASIHFDSSTTPGSSRSRP